VIPAGRRARLLASEHFSKYLI